MFLPIGTDAPIYHRPIGTGILILLNIAGFWLTAGGTATNGWLLTFGNGLHPTEWILSAFLHFGLGHLIGNMIFLWVFGLIIEGKLGFARFLLLYFSLCLADGFVGQFLMLHSSGLSEGAGGASGVIYAMLAIAWIWAPKNCIEFLYFFGYFFVGSIEISLQVLACLYIGLDLLSAWLIGFEASTPVFHLLGAGVGVGAGLLFLKNGWVDCEGWDVLSLRGRDHPATSQVPELASGLSRRKTKQAVRPPLNPQDRIKRVQSWISTGEFEKAWFVYAALRKESRAPGLSQHDLDTLRKGMMSAGDWNATAALLQEYLQRFEPDSIKHRLALAAVLVRNLNRPRAAIKVLEELSQLQLDPPVAQRYHQLLQEARQQIHSGILEIHSSD